MSKRRKTKKEIKCCHMCEYCLYIGEGDYMCDTNTDIVIEEWQPTEDYYSCGGKKFVALKGGEGDESQNESR